MNRNLFHRLAVQVIPFIFFVLNAKIGDSQTVSPPLPQTQWHIQEMSTANGNFYSPYSSKKSIIYLEDGSVVAAVQYDKEEWGAVHLSSEGKMLWQTRVNSYVTGISKIGDNFLLLYSDQDNHKSGGFIGPREESLSVAVYAALLNGKTGKIIQKKQIYNNRQKVFIGSSTLNQPDGSLSHILIRVSNYKRFSYKPGKVLEDRLTSDQILIVDVSQDLEIRTTKIKANGKDGLFVGAIAGQNDDFIFGSILNDQLMFERFKKDGTNAGILSTPLTVRTDKSLEPLLNIDPANPEIIFVGLRYSKKNKDIVNQVYEFNFATKKISGSGEQILDKAYLKSLEFVENKDLVDVKVFTASNLFIACIISKDNRIAVIKKDEYFEHAVNPQDNTLKYRSDVLVVDIYNKEWKLLKTISLKKRFEAFMTVGNSVGVHVENNKLSMVMTAVAGVLKYATVYACIDLDKLELEKFVTLQRDNYKNWRPVEGSASIWFPGGVFLEYLVEKGGMLKSQKDYYSIFQKIVF